ncbi:hypothetical protein [Paraburkholderia acidiphila]|uniref:Helix-turn-helix domain-containing protein n=1 Tax=Paraburkholderia acidiphila TaxID=2571747 RepID=A0A7Z2G8U4_9BURK|nr:hypothetical protein [Paraburkholderia acidiphila]QGZ57182.1 hypothetical protein FAZ97_19845 [Paraburkholderia acidiphila]
MTDLDDFEQRVRRTEADIVRFCEQHDFEITGVDRVVDEVAAAMIIGYGTVDALRKAIKDGTLDLPYRMIGKSRKYRIVDLAAHIERNYRCE